MSRLFYSTDAQSEPVNGVEEKPTSIFGNSSGIFGGNSSFSFADLAKNNPGDGFASKSGTCMEKVLRSHSL